MHEARIKWFDIGLGLGLSNDMLEAIEVRSSVASVCLRRMLSKWLHSDKDKSWKALAIVMGSKVVERSDLKESILKQYC